MDYIKENKGKIKTLLREYLDSEIVNNIILNPRLISLGDDFNKYDEYAIKKMPYDVDLIKYQIFDKDLIILEKNYHNYVLKSFDPKIVRYLKKNYPDIPVGYLIDQKYNLNRLILI